MELATTIAILTFASLISFINERLNELIIVPRIEGTRFTEWKVVMAFATGFGLGALLAIDFITPLASMFGLELRFTWAGWVVSAVVIGLGSPIIHDIIMYINAVKGTAKAQQFLTQETALEVIEARPTDIGNGTETAIKEALR